MIGSLSVMSVKGLGLALMQTVTGTENQLGNWLTWFCFVTLVLCVSVQMNFLNKVRERLFPKKDPWSMELDSKICEMVV